VGPAATGWAGGGVGAKAALGEGRRLLTAEGGPEDWRTSHLHINTCYVAGVAGDADTARREADRAVAVARRSPSQHNSPTP
jgi:hypothetical protein